MPFHRPSRPRQRTVTLPLRLDGTGSVAMGIMDMESQASVKALELTVHNVSDTLVPGVDWVESAASFDFTPLGITDALTHAKQSSWLVELHLSGAQQQSKLQCPIASFPSPRPHWPLARHGNGVDLV